MPAPTIRCEFCPEEHIVRSDAYATHVQSKHKKEITTLLLDDFVECNVNTIQSYASSLSVKSMPIYSKLYQDAEYWFGVKSLFYYKESSDAPHNSMRPDTHLKPAREDQELLDYLKREENLKAHNEYIEELLRGVSLFDFIAYKKDILVRSTDVMNLKRELSALKMEHKNHLESSAKEIDRLKTEVEMWKETADEKEFIADIKRDASASRSQCQRAEATARSLKQQLEDLKNEFNEKWSTLNYGRSAEISHAMDEVDKARKDAEKARASIKVEAQKLFDKEMKRLRKEKDKKKEEKQKALKEAKKLRKLAEMSSDSDSETDSD